jgi:hypothetical protein
MTAPGGQFAIRRFRGPDGLEVRLYCRLLKERVVMAASFRLFEDRQGHKWLEIDAPEHSCLTPLGEASFEKRVADELLAMGIYKYSG